MDTSYTNDIKNRLQTLVIVLNTVLSLGSLELTTLLVKIANEIRPSQAKDIRISFSS